MYVWKCAINPVETTAVSPTAVVVVVLTAAVVSFTGPTKNPSFLLNQFLALPTLLHLEHSTTAPT